MKPKKNYTTKQFDKIIQKANSISEYTIRNVAHYVVNTKKIDKPKKTYKTVTDEWAEMAEPQFTLPNTRCPNKKCKKRIDWYELRGCYEGERINKTVKCPDCGERFKLKVRSAL